MHYFMYYIYVQNNKRTASLTYPSRDKYLKVMVDKDIVSAVKYKNEM